MSRNVKAIILAGGLGTRLKPLTDRVPKCLIPIAGRPLLDYWVDESARLNVAEARVNTHAHVDQVRDYISEVRRSGRLNLTEFHEPRLLGSAGTLTANPDFADDASEILVIYADNLSNVDLIQMLAYHRSHDDPFTMLLCPTAVPQSCGIVELDDADRIIGFEEKPKFPRSNLANGGIYIIEPDAYREIAALGAFDLGFDVLPRFVGRMRGFRFDGYHRDIGTHAALEQAQRDVLEFFPRPEPTKDRRPAVFLDRDGTLIEHVHYLSDPAQVRLVPDGAESVRRLREAGFACVLVTNQAAVGKGLISENDLEEIHHEMNRQLSEFGTELDAIYYCPVPGSGSDRTSIEHPDRKPGPGMLLRAATEHRLDLGASWMVGDMISDVLAGHYAGCRGSILVQGDPGSATENDVASVPCEAVADLRSATNLIIGLGASCHSGGTFSEIRR